MTQPGALGYGAPRDPIVDLVRDIEDLKRTVAAMQTQLVNNGTMAVPSGGSITVIDGSGNTVATLGTVGGVVDVHAQDPSSGNTLPMSQLAFGAVAGDDGGSSYQQNVLSTWVQGPISLTVQVKTGRLWVLAGAQITTQPSVAQNAFMSWQLSGPTNVAVSIGRALVIASPGNVGLGAGYPFLHHGLTPGTYTITDWYRTTGTLSGGTTGPIFSSRSLIAIPF